MKIIILLILCSISSTKACSLPLNGNRAICPSDGFLKLKTKQTKTKFIEKPIYNQDFSWRENPYLKNTKVKEIQENKTLVKKMLNEAIVKYARNKDS